MSVIFGHGLVIFMAFFAVMNPIANTTVFAGLTGDMDKQQRTKVAVKSLAITFIIIVVFAYITNCWWYTSIYDWLPYATR